ncbi:GLPGLI family protein [Aequorivita sp. H23M31]|uniref:GLPGLI family protein n=1 Tax=Aequorivita ciconiae TaxID=2494375 RepID=A0A410G330_9FLAO|nr:GLPGLI family protein [Aequorivita sp. H23M31]QAA81687.1 GLPGLI family protein [Aequorivita sp. H23M31]
MLKHLYLTIIISLLACYGFAQQISGSAFYTSMYKEDEPKFDEEEMEDPLTQALAEQLKKGFLDEYELQFNQEESIFKKIPKLEKPDPNKGGISISMSLMGENEILYKNIKENKLINEKELYGKPFLIQDTIEIRDWKLSKESKTIGEYVCFKATYLPPSLSGDKDNEENSSTHSETKEEEIIAWYTPQIPVKNGPKNYGGLPGLILEVQEGKLIFLCTKIVLSPKEPMGIIKPSKGKKVSQKEFDAILEKKNEEMRENFKTRKRRE